MKCAYLRKVKIRYEDISKSQVRYRRQFLHEDGYFFRGYVPCGKCYGCRTNVRNQWTFRLRQEAQAEGVMSTIFVTLTEEGRFNDATNNLVFKSEIQQLNKNLRKAGNKYTFYAIGEYGTKHHRAHYHMLIFCRSDVEKVQQDIRYYWQVFDSQHRPQYSKGFVYFEEACPANIHYITHYHVRPKIPRHVQDRTYYDENGKLQGASFVLSSQGLGIHYMTERRIQFLHQSKTMILHDAQGNSFSLPRYYRKKYHLLRNPEEDAIPKEYYPNWCKTPEDKIKYINDLRLEYKRREKKYNSQEKF